MPKTFKVQQLSEQSTASATFVDVPGTTLTFTPANTGQTWMVFTSGKIRSSDAGETSCEIRLVINGVEHDLCGHQNNAATTPNGAGFFMFDRITGVATLQTVKLQHRAAAGTTFSNSLRVVVALVPAGADFQYFESNGIVSEPATTNSIIGQLQFTPSSAGEYLVFGSVKHREFPGGSTSQAWFEDVGATPPLHPDAPAGTHHSNARDAWNPATTMWHVPLTPFIQTFNIRFTTSGPGTAASEHRYRKIMVLRSDSFEAAYYSEALAQTTTVAAGFTTKNSLAVPAPPATREFLSFQNARISGTGTAGTTRKSGELRRAGVALVQTNHRINRNGSNTQGYHHFVSAVDRADTAAAITFANGFLSPDAGTIECAESTIVVLRYPPDAQAGNAPFYGMNA